MSAYIADVDLNALLVLDFVKMFKISTFITYSRFRKILFSFAIYYIYKIHFNFYRPNVRINFKSIKYYSNKIRNRRNASFIIYSRLTNDKKTSRHLLMILFNYWPITT